jgi:catechol 2,3-dioxygenase-like lactoylglutathione lyase family enzyme
MKFNKLVPELLVTDFDKSIIFYTKILDFKVEYQRGNEKGEHKFAFLSKEGSQLMLDEIVSKNSKKDSFITSKLQYPLGRGINFQIEVKDVNILYKNILKNKYPIQMKLKENKYRQNNKILKQKEFMVMDPDGYLLRFIE